MTGLIMKDMLVSKRSLKAYLGIMIFYVVLTFMGVFSIAFVTAFVSVMLIMLPIGAFTYDEQAKWDRYAMALPLGRRAVVGARYCFTLLVTLISLALAVLSGVAVSVTGQGSFIEVMFTAFTTLAAGLLVADLLLPLCYKLGAERARPFLYAIVFIPIIVLFLAFRMGVRIDTSSLDRLALSSPGALLALSALPVLAALALMLVSYLISCRVAAGKEY